MENEWLRITLPLHGGPGVSAPRAPPEDAQVRSLPEPRRALLAQGTQALLSLQGLYLREMHTDNREAESDGGAGGAS